MECQLSADQIYQNVLAFEIAFNAQRIKEGVLSGNVHQMIAFTFGLGQLSQHISLLGLCEAIQELEGISASLTEWKKTGWDKNPEATIEWLKRIDYNMCLFSTQFKELLQKNGMEMTTEVRCLLRFYVIVFPVIRDQFLQLIKVLKSANGVTSHV